MSDRSAGLAPSRVTAVLGPTNTGKTHLAVERMLGHASGMIGLPLRLLAREIYDRIVKQRGAAAVALVLLFFALILLLVSNRLQAWALRYKER